MARDIHPLTPDDLPELSRFLTAGFHAPADADFAAPEVLHWKYLEPLETNANTNLETDTSSVSHLDAHAESTAADSCPPRSFIARNESKQIIGHIGLCRTTFEGRAINVATRAVPTIHIIDWLGSPDHRSVGMSLMRKAHEGIATQFGLGVSQAALVVGERAGYELRSCVPVYAHVLRARYWLRTGNLSPWQRGLYLARTAGQCLTHPPATPHTTIVLRQVPAFGQEIGPIVSEAGTNVILTQRSTARLNAFLRFPRQVVSGWHLLDVSGRLRGFAVLNLVPRDQGRTHTGKVVDCLLDDMDITLWHAAIRTLTRELARQGADIAQAYGSTPWTAEALRRSGYTSQFAVKFHIRDRQGLIPRDVPFHLTPLEGDYAYT
jgi:hypothetical protein